jgi:hypothetical protein
VAGELSALSRGFDDSFSTINPSMPHAIDAGPPCSARLPDWSIGAEGYTLVAIVLRRSAPHLTETLPTAANASPGASSGLALEQATAPQSGGASLTALYLPREVFFGRLAFAGAFVPVCASDFGRFFPATSGSFQVDVLPLRH